MTSNLHEMRLVFLIFLLLPFHFLNRNLKLKDTLIILFLSNKWLKVIQLTQWVHFQVSSILFNICGIIHLLGFCYYIFVTIWKWRSVAVTFLVKCSLIFLKQVMFLMLFSLDYWCLFFCREVLIYIIIHLRTMWRV